MTGTVRRGEGGLPRPSATRRSQGTVFSGQRQERGLVEAVVQVLVHRGDLVDRDVDAVLVRFLAELVDGVGEQDLAPALVAELVLLHRALVDLAANLRRPVQAAHLADDDLLADLHQLEDEALAATDDHRGDALLVDQRFEDLAERARIIRARNDDLLVAAHTRRSPSFAASLARHAGAWSVSTGARLSTSVPMARLWFRRSWFTATMVSLVMISSPTTHRPGVTATVEPLRTM